MIKESLLPPSGDAFCVIARGFMDGGDACLEKINSDQYEGQIVYACCFLYFRAIELFLKSALKDREVDSVSIRTASHSIDKLLTLLNGVINPIEFCLSEEEMNFLRNHGEDYTAKWFEYPHKLHSSYPEPSRAKLVCHKFAALTKNRPEK